jgi:hypothetical protein
MSQVIIGTDPHKRSATIEVMAADESVLEGCQGIGRHTANRMVSQLHQLVLELIPGGGTGRHRLPGGCQVAGQD